MMGMEEKYYVLKNVRCCPGAMVIFTRSVKCRISGQEPERATERHGPEPFVWGKNITTKQKGGGGTGGV